MLVVGEQSFLEFCPLGQYALTSGEVYIVRRYIAKGFVMPLGVVVSDEAGNLPFNVQGGSKSQRLAPHWAVRHPRDG